MPAYFFDSSALVKCYVAEAGSEWARSIVDDDDNVIHVASLTRVEIVARLLWSEARLTRRVVRMCDRSHRE